MSVYSHNPPERGKRNVTPSGSDQVSWIDIDLNAQQREGLVVFVEEFEYRELLEWIAEKCATGHSVTVQPEKEWFYARAMGMSGSTHVSMALTARATTAQNALYALAFRDLVVLEGKWPTKSTKVLDI
jgi:hypothetical protein